MVAPYGPALALMTLPGCSERSGAALEMPAFAGASELDQWRLETHPLRLASALSRAALPP